MHRLKILTLLAFVTFMWTVPGFSLDIPPIKPNDPRLETQIPIGASLLTASDPDRKMTPAGIMSGQFDADFIAHPGKNVVSYGLNRRWPHWAAFVIENTEDKPKNLLLEVGYSALDRLDLYQVTAQGEIINQSTLGDRIPFSDRPIRYRHPVFKLDLQPGLNYFLAKVDTTSSVIFEFTLYQDAAFKNAKFKETIVVGILLGGIVVILFYNLFLFLSTRDSNYGIYVLYVASYFVFAMSFYGITPYFAFSQWKDAPLTGWDLYFFIDTISVTACLFTIRFLDLKNKAPILQKILLVFLTMAALNALANLFFLQGRVQRCADLTLFVSFFLGILLVTSGMRLALKGYTPAVFFALAWTFVVAGNCLVLMGTAGVIDRSFISTWGQLIGANMEMLFLSFALGSRINLIKAEKLRAERQMLQEAEEKKKLQAELIATQEDNIRTLDAKVQERTQAVREILTHIKQGIFTFRKDLIVDAEISDHLPVILGHRNVSGKHVDHAIFAKATVSADQISQTMTALNFSMGQDREFGWDTNSHLLLKEIEISDDRGTHSIELDWGPIAGDDGTVNKVLVAMRDITEVKMLRAKASEKELEAGMLLEMLSVDLERTRKFLERTLVAWNEIDRALANYLKQPTESYDALFRHYHTIKGNARSLGFQSISTHVHEVETILKEIGPRAQEKQMERLLEASRNSRKLLEAYHRIFADKFARLFGKKKQIQGTVFEDFFNENILPMLNKISLELNKPIPEVVINNPQRFMIMSDEIEDVFQGILNHLIRNAMDHGIEAADVRVAKRKPPQGRLTIDINIDADKKLTILLRDDGQGLNLSRIYQLGRDKGMLPMQPSPEELLAIIFKPGFSTAHTTTLISGRGIGMDAVRYYSNSLGSSFELVPDRPIDQDMLDRIRDPEAAPVYLTFFFQAIGSLKKSGKHPATGDRDNNQELPTLKTRRLA